MNLKKIVKGEIETITYLPSKYVFRNIETPVLKQIVKDEEIVTVEEKIKQNRLVYNPTLEMFLEYGFKEYDELVQDEEYATKRYDIVDGEIKLVVDRLSEEEIAEIEKAKEEEIAKIEKAREEAEKVRAELEAKKHLAKVKAREEEFNKGFFYSETFEGYIRKQVTMDNGEVRSFLFDLFPTIDNALNEDKDLIIPVYYYDKPESFEEDVDFIQLQHTGIVTTDFVNETRLQVQKEFKRG